MHLLRIFALAGLVLAGTTELALAGPGIAAAGGFIGWLVAGSLGAKLVGAGIRLAVGLGISFLAKRIKAKFAQDDIAGVSGRLMAGGTIPRSFVIGRFPAEQSLIYVNTWGTSGKTPNAYLTLVIALSDLPVAGLAELWINGEKVTFGATHADFGDVVTEYTKDGKDHLWVKFYDGSQIAADPYLVSKFSGDANRPYDAGRVGTGVAYMIVTALVNNELFTGFPKFLAVLDGIALYDVREDTTAGGSGSQTWAAPSSWTEADGAANPMVAIYNVLRGIRYGGDWVYGGQTIGAASLPYAAWSAAQSECDVPISLSGGGTEAQFTCGLVVRFDDQPADTIERILGTCNGRIAEIGGTYKPRAGAPGSSVFSFTDADILTSDEQSFDPFPSLGQTVNGIAGRYIEPGEGWTLKDAPQLRRPDLETEDGGRRQTAALVFDAVTSGTAVQRLQLSALLDERAFRRHALPMPPDAFLLEPLDVVTWTSTRNGYVSKTFEIIEADDLPNLDMGIGIKELDPNAYDWDENEDELPVTIAPPLVVRPPVQQLTGWAASGVLITHDNGQRKAGVLVEWDADVDDVVAVRIQIRLASDSSLILDATTNAWDDGEAVLTQNLASITSYEARGKYIAGSARETTWSDWIAFTTLDARVSQAELDSALDARIRVIEQQQRQLLTLREDLDVVSGAVATHATSLLEQIGRTRRSLGSRYEENKAGIETVETVTTGIDSALASLFQELFSITSAGEAAVLFRMFATSVPSGALAAMAMQLRAGIDGEWAEAAMEMAAYYDAELDQYYSKIRMMADRIEFVTNGAILPAYLLAVADEPSSVPIISGTPNTITADLSKRRLTYHTLMTASARLEFPTGAKAGFTWKHQIEQDGTGGWSLTLSSDFIGSAPTIGTNPEDLTLLVCEVIRTDPPIAMVAVHGTGNIAGGSPTDGHEAWDSPGVHEWVVPLHTSITFRIWGGGGPGGAAGIYSTGIGTTGGTTSIDFQGAATNISATGGQSGKSVRASGEPTGGAGGVASGGDTNTNGNAGTAGNESAGDSATRGEGADAPGAGGGTGGAPRALSSEGNGRPGTSPGAGGSGAKNFYGGSYQTGGGGGSGAFVEVTLSLPAGSVILLTVGAGGVRSSDGKHLGGNGANGRIEAEWS